MRRKILAYIIAVLTITTCMIQLIPRQNNIFKIASQGEGESGFLTNNNLNQKKVYLTFDDGPSDHTDEILDILKKNKVRATFFVVGKETEHAKKMYRRIILEGHTLGMHSYSHNYDQIYASVGAFSKDLMKLQKYLYDLTEVKSYIYRFRSILNRSINHRLNSDILILPPFYPKYSCINESNNNCVFSSDF